MANVTQDLYPNAEEKNYVKVVFQRGRDVADAELNELQDIIRGHLAQQMRASKEEGIYGSGELLSVADGSSNDLTIRAGAFYIEGMRYTLAADELLSVLTADAISTPGADQTDAIALDFVEVEITGVDDSAIVYSGLGETARRRQLSVTWRYLTDVSTFVDPYASLPDAVFSGNTRQVVLAYVRRYSGQAAINPGDVVDVRPRPTSQQLAVDFDVAMLSSVRISTRFPSSPDFGTFHRPLFIRKTQKWLAPGQATTSNLSAIAHSSTGERWSRAWTGSVTTALRTIAKNEDESLILAAGGGVLAYSTDYGVTWAEVATSGVLAGLSVIRCILFDPISGEWIIGGTAGGAQTIITSPTPTTGGSWTTRFTGTVGYTITNIVSVAGGFVAATTYARVVTAATPTGTWTQSAALYGGTAAQTMYLAYDPAAGILRLASTFAPLDLTEVWESSDDGFTWYKVLTLAADQVTGAASGGLGFVSYANEYEGAFFYIPESRLWVISGETVGSGGGGAGPAVVVISGTSYAYTPVDNAAVGGSIALGFDPQSGVAGGSGAGSRMYYADVRRIPTRLI